MSNFEFRELMISLFTDKDELSDPVRHDGGKLGKSDGNTHFDGVDAPHDYCGIRKSEFGVGDKQISEVRRSEQLTVQHQMSDGKVEACGFCTGCTGCSSCTGCTGCTTCTGCTFCSGCTGCTSCSSCSGSRYEQDPEQEVGDPELAKVTALLREEIDGNTDTEQSDSKEKELPYVLQKK